MDQLMCAYLSHTLVWSGHIGSTGGVFGLFGRNSIALPPLYLVKIFGTVSVLPKQIFARELKTLRNVPPRTLSLCMIFMMLYTYL